jgi:hypothetical protein
MLVMRIRRTTAVRWIEEADARRLCELAFTERQAARQHVSSAVSRRLSAFGAALRSTLFARPPKRHDCRC